MTQKLKKEEAKEEKKLTVDERIEALKNQQEQLKEVFLKISGALEVLEQMKEEE